MLNLKKILGSLAFFIASASVVLAFQNCNGNFQSLDSLSMNSSTGISLASKEAGVSSGIQPCDPAAGWICPENPLIPSETVIGAWYSLYFYKEDGNLPKHWTEWTRYRPELGYYDAGDVIRQQYPYFKRAGINYLILDNTNGWGADGGLIYQNAKKVFDQLPQDIPIAMAQGFPLWNASAPAPQRVIDMNSEATNLWNEFAQRSNYLRWYDAGTNSYKPLFVVYNDIQNDHPEDEIKRYWKDDRFTTRYSAGDSHSNNPLLAPYANEGIWGWAIHYPQIISSETMAVQPGHNTTHLPNRTAIPMLRDKGASYMKQWLYVIKHQPRNIIIPSWNDWAEETAIEPGRRVVGTAEAYVDHYGEETPDWYLQITEAYANLRRGLAPDTYYRTEDDATVYKVSGGKLVPQSALPRRKPVIMLPAGYLAQFKVATPPPTPVTPPPATPTPVVTPTPVATVTPTPTLPPSVPTPPQPVIIPAGYFMVGINIYYSNGGAYCYVPNMEMFVARSGFSSSNALPRHAALPPIMKNDGTCQ